MTQPASSPETAQQITLSSVAVYHGPSPYAPEPVVVAELSLAKPVIARAHELIADLTAKFDMLDLPEAAQDAGDGGDALAGFAVQWAHASLTQASGNVSPFGHRRVEDGRFHLWMGFQRSDISYLGLSLAARALEMAALKEPVACEFSKQLIDLRDACIKHHYSIQAELIIAAARSRDLPFAKAWGMPQFWRLGWGAKSELLFSGSSGRDGFIGGGIIANKLQSKSVIRQLGLPTPEFAIARDDGELDRAVANVGFPCVVKPLDLHGGAGVSAGITSIDHAREAFARARSLSRQPILVEAFVQGDDYRLVFADGAFRGALKKMLPAVVGDGKHTIMELVQTLNAGRQPYYKLGPNDLAEIPIDKAFELHLAGQGLSPESIPADGQKVTGHGTSNQSTGGTFADVSATVHPHVRIAAQSLAQTLGANVIGLDYMTTDITRSWHDVPGGFIEMNLSPGLTNFTKTGWTEVETGNFVLGEETARIALQIVIVADDMLDEAEKQVSPIIEGDNTAGLAAHDRARVGRLALAVRQEKPWAGVSMLLGNCRVEKVVVLAGSAQIRRHGLPVDRADRIWLCDDSLPDDWRRVLERSARTTVREGGLSDFVREFCKEDADQP